METNKNLNYNSILTGLLVGLILPVIVFIFFYASQNISDFSVFVSKVFKAGIFTHLISLCAVPNLLVFFVFMWTNRLLSAKGVIGATFIYTIIVILIKF